MRINAITCCSGGLYASYFMKSVQIWLDTLDSLTVVCKSTDDEVLALAGPSNLKIVTTTVFEEHTAHFNKGAALNYAYTTSKPSDWVLHVDSDIIPPRNWRDFVKDLKPGFLYGACRVMENKHRRTSPLDRKPYGYFQMWHTSDPVSWKWPMFSPIHSHCGRYDWHFMTQWGQDKWVTLPLILTHQGTTKVNWFGGKRLRKELENSKAYKIRMQAEIWRELPVPNSKISLHLNSDHYSPEEARQMIEWAGERGPFEVKLDFTYKGDNKLELEDIKELIHG